MTPFSASGFRSSLRGGDRFIRYEVAERPRWWSRRRWVVLFTYLADGIHDRDLDVGRYRTLEDANAAAARQWARVEQEHAEALAHRQQAQQ